MSEQPQQAVDELVTLSYDLDPEMVTFTLDEQAFPLDAVLAAAYGFTQICYARVAHADDKTLSLTLEPKAKGPQKSDEVTLDALAHSFAESLMSHCLRLRIEKSTEELRVQYTSKALFAQSAQATIAELLAELDEEELDDDLDIPVPWATES